MLSKTITVYAIQTAKSEYSSSYDELFDTFEDAIDASLNSADWFSTRGTCTIDKILIGCGDLYEVEERWRLYEGKVIEHKKELKEKQNETN